MNQTPGGILYRNGADAKRVSEVEDYLRPTDTFGTIGVISGERGSYARFWTDVSRAHMAMLVKNQNNARHTEMGADICGNCNNLVRNMLGDWLWIMGDDHTFSPGLLPRLLSHDVDVVVPHCVQRNPPWKPVVYGGEVEEGVYFGADLPEDELVEIHAAGSAGMLVKRHVFDAIGDPWFTPSPGAQGLNEDVHFCQKVRDAGFKIYCDSGAMLGHISNYVVYPLFIDGHWHMRAEFDQHTHVPIRRLEAIPVPA